MADSRVRSLVIGKRPRGERVGCYMYLSRPKRREFSEGEKERR